MNKALLVGINYPGTRNELNGCVNDVVMMNKIITDHYGFDKHKNKRVLVDNDATTKNILEGLDWLIAGAQEGDVLMFHYSGHGTQIVDAEFDLDDEPDGKDECLCPVDLNWRDKIIKDDDLRDRFNTLPKGVNLTVVLDCCHSGSGIKDLAYIPTPNQSRYIEPPLEISVRTQLFENLELKKREIQTVGYENQSGILISGCRSDQTSADAWIHNKYQGACTYFLYEVLRDNNYDINYSDLVNELNKRLKKYGYTQRPELNCKEEFAKKMFLNPIV